MSRCSSTPKGSTATRSCTRSPGAFRPERFLGASDGYSYLPFGGGAHRCLGAALAMLELELVLEAIATRVEMAPAGRPARAVRRGITLAPGNQGRVRIF